jgi:hypothetical protein
MHPDFRTRPRPLSRRRAAALCAALLLALSACGGGSSGQPGGSAPPPQVETLPKGITVLAGAIGGDGNADGPVGRLREPTALAIDRAGTLYVGDFGATVRTATPGTDGTMVLGTRWKGAEAPRALALDAAGNLVGIIGNRIVRIAPDGTLTPLAGADEDGTVDGTGSQARFTNPRALAIDAVGLIWVADLNAIRTVTAAGVVGTHRAASAALFDKTGDWQGMPIGLGRNPTGLAFDNAGNLVIAVSDAPVRKVTPAGVRVDTTLTAGTAIAADRNGNLYGFHQCTLYKADAAGQVTVLAGAATRHGTADGPGTAVGFGDDYLCDVRIVVNDAGAVFVTDPANKTVRKVAPDGTVGTVAGKAPQRGMVDGTGTAARFNDGALDLAFDGRDSLYVVQENKVRKITRSGVVTTLNLPEKDAGQNPVKYFTGGVAYQGSVIGVANHVVYLVDDNGGMRALAGSPAVPRWTDGTGTQAGFGEVCGATRDGAGNVYLLDCHAQSPRADAIPDLFENHIRKVTPAGIVTTVYTVPQDDGTRQPSRIVADRQGNVYAATNNSAVIRVAANGATSSIPVSEHYGGLLAVDAGGNLYQAPFYVPPAIVEKLGADGQGQLVAGRRDQFGLIPGSLPGTLNGLLGLAVDDRGTIYVMSENAVVRIVQ